MLTGPVPNWWLSRCANISLHRYWQRHRNDSQGKNTEPEGTGNTLTAAGSQTPAVSLSQPQCYPGPHHLSHISWLWWSAPISRFTSKHEVFPSFPPSVTSTFVVTSLASDNHLLGAITRMPEGRSDKRTNTHETCLTHDLGSLEEAVGSL